MASTSFDFEPMKLAATIMDVADIGGDVEANMEVAAATLEADIKKRAPVDTGHLRGSYRTKVKSKGDTVTAHVGTNVEYSVYQEYGTRYHRAQPHVRPALEANSDIIKDAVLADTIRDTIS